MMQLQAHNTFYQTRRMLQTQQKHTKINAHYTLHRHNILINAKKDENYQI